MSINEKPDDDPMNGILDPLYGIEQSTSLPDYYHLHSYSRDSSPPSYLLQILLTIFYGVRLPDGGEKSAWQAPLSFNGSIWIIVDFKRSVWKIYGPKNKEQDSSDLRKKLLASAAILNKRLASLAREKKIKGEFSIENSFGRSSRLFWKFRLLAESEKKHVERASKKRLKKISNLANFFNGITDKKDNLKAFTIAATIFYFAKLDAIFDTAFALFETKSMRFFDFENKSWQEKLKLFIKPWDASLEPIYIELVEIRKAYRDAMVHSKSNSYFRFERFGLIPFDSNDLPQALETSHSMLFSTERTEQIFGVFDKFDSFLKKHKKFRFAVAYAESSLAIHFDDKFASELAPYMKSLKAFREELNHRIDLECAHFNMEI